MSSIQLELLTNHPKSFLINWLWTNSIRNQLKNRSISDIKTILKVFTPSNQLKRTVDLSNSIKNQYKLTDISVETELKVCINITIKSSSIINKPSHENCTNYYSNKWSLPVATMLAAFLVFTLIVALIFMAKRIGKNRRKLLIKKSSKKRCNSTSNSKRTGDSYVLIYPAQCASNDDEEGNEVDTDDDNSEEISNENDDVELNNPTNQAKCQDNFSHSDSSISIDQNQDCNLNSNNNNNNNNNEIDLKEEENKDNNDGNCDEDESDCESDTSSQPPNGEEDESGCIVKCDCGLIHLVGTELECDTFLNDPCSYLGNNQDSVSSDEGVDKEKSKDDEQDEKKEAV